MGKAKKERIHEKYGDSPSMRERIAMRMDESNANNTARIRAQAMEYWMELQGVDDPSLVDHSENDPIVHLEWFLCDFRMIAKLTAGKRDEVLEQMDDLQR